jgi:hypothetical protein
MEGLRHRLDGEGDLGIADGVDLPVDGGDGDPEQVGIGLAERRDVVGWLAGGHARDALMQFGEVIRHGRERAARLCVAQRSHGIDFVQRDPQATA